MQYVFLFFLGWFLVCLPALVYAAIIEGRRRKDARNTEEQIASLTRRFYGLEEQLKKAVAAHAFVAAPEKPAVPVAVVAPVPLSDAVKVLEEQPAVKPAAEIVPRPLPPTPPVFPVRPEPAVKEFPRVVIPTPIQSPPPALPVAPPPANVAARIQSPPPPQFRQTLPPRTEPPVDTAGPRKKKRISAAMEEAVGTNWLAKIGTVLVVIGAGLFLASRWEQMSAIMRIALFYLVGGGLLGAGIYWERKENFKVLGRVLIGGGWAILYITTAAANHWRSAKVVDSVVIDLFLLLLVAALMVWHTLKYNSQTVTGTAFLLGFIALILSHTTVFSLLAGLILVSGMTVIVLQRRWFELEVFGILASYLSHLYWLYWIINPMGAVKHRFPEFWISIALLSAFWVIFRIAYLLHRISEKEQESVSTVAALLNPVLFLAALRYQAFETKWAFATLLIVGALEFFFGQLPVARRRKIPFQLLSSLGALLMIVAVPYKYAGNGLVLLWLAGAQAFVLAGVFAREKLFRWFGGITFLLAAFYLLSTRIVFLAPLVVSGAPPYDMTAFVIFAVAAMVFYANAHVISRIWPELFQDQNDRQAIHAISMFASLFAVGAIYSLVPAKSEAVALAALALVLSWAGKQFNVPDTVYQAHWISVVAIIDVTVHGLSLETLWHGTPERILALGAVTALLYLSSRFVRLSQTIENHFSSVIYRWAACGLITALIWKQASDWLSAVLWIGLALVLSMVAEILRANEFRWQAFVLVVLACCRALMVNFTVGGEFHGVSYRLISVTLIAAGAYLLVARKPHPRLHPAYTCAATFLLAYLAFQEAPSPWIAVAWVSLGTVLAFSGRFWKNRVLLWQSHVLAVATALAIFAYNFPPHRHSALQATTVLIACALLYLSTWVTNVAGLVEDERIAQAYSWLGSLLLTWLAWYQFQPISVALVWAVLGLVLFEIGFGKTSSYLCAQGYVALVSSFIRIFFANLNSSAIDSALYTVLPLVPIYFWVYARLHSKKTGETALKIRMEYILACVGTATVAALARFVPQDKETVVIGYSLIVLTLLAVALRTGLKIFLYQALVVLGVTGFRLSLHNFYQLQNSFSSSTFASALAILLLAVGIPIGFKLREPTTENSEVDHSKPPWITILVRRPEQIMFFVPVVLMAILVVIKIDFGWNVLALAVEGLVVALGGFFAQERSFRLTGLGLLIFCVLKFFAWDFWKFSDPRAHYLSMMGLGALILVGSYLFSRNRKALRELL